MNDVLIVTVPLVAILAGLFFNNRAISEIHSELRSEMNVLRGEIKDVRSETKDLRTEMNRRFDEIDPEQRYLHGVSGELKGRIDTIEKRG